MYEESAMMVHEWITLHTGFVFPNWFLGWGGFAITILLALLIGALYIAWFLNPSVKGEDEK